MANRSTDHQSHRLKVSLIEKGDRGHADCSAMTWGELIDLLEDVKVDKRHTQAQYDAMDVDEKGFVKDVGAFVPGVFRAGKRRAEALIERTALTLDIDEVSPRQYDRIMEGLTPLGEWEWFATTTRGHRPDSPRCRIVLPLTRPVDPEEYAPLCRIVGSHIFKDEAEAMDAIDTVSFRAAQIMYRPSRSKDGVFEAVHNQGEMIDPDEVFEQWGGDWRDFSNLPYSQKRGVGREHIGAKAENPTEKRGIVGAFCRTFSVEDAIGEFLPEIYKKSKIPSGKPRYTYVDGSGTNGVVVEDDGLFIYSHHGTDPCGGRLVNAFDMVRLHMFGDEDEGYDDGDPTELPSYKSMGKFAREDPEVNSEFQDDMSDRAVEDFDDDDEEDDSEVDVDPDEFEDIAPKHGDRVRLKGVPKNLLSIPGKLNHVVEYYNKTARKPQPQFAVQTALAVGSVVLGRNWTTNRDNFTSLYMLDIAPTSSGKEHSKRVIERILEDANEADLVGPKAYTSEAGVMSALLMQPRHISISDEFGRYLASSRASGNANKQDAQSAFMEIFGRLDGVYRGTGYSTHNMTKEQAEAVKNRKIVRPALTILGMTTPATFYEALGNMDVKDGFLNRFLIVNSPVERQLSRPVHLSKPPAAIIDWIRDHAWAHDSSDEDDMSEVRAKLEPQMVTDPVVIPFASECDRLLEEMELEILEEMNRLDEFGMAELFGRTIEIAMRVALIVAVSEGANRIRRRHLEWARDYVFFYHRQMAEQFAANIGLTEFETVIEDILLMIRKKGRRGATEREITQSSRSFRRLATRDRDEVFARLKRDYGVKFKEVESEDERKRGRPRKAYVAPK